MHGLFLVLTLLLLPNVIGNLYDLDVYDYGILQNIPLLALIILIIVLKFEIV